MWELGSVKKKKCGEKQGCGEYVFVSLQIEVL